MARYLKKTSFPITLVILVVTAMFTLRGEAQQKTSKPYAPGTRSILTPQVALPVATATSVAVRDIPASPETDMATLEDFERRVLNNLNSGFDLVQPPGAPLVSFDAAIAGKPSSIAAPQPSSVTPPAIGSFE